MMILTKIFMNFSLTENYHFRYAISMRSELRAKATWTVSILFYKSILIKILSVMKAAALNYWLWVMTQV